jgi:hypothetical protein
MDETPETTNHAGVEEAIRLDDSLSPENKSALLSVYRALAAKP